MNNQLTKLIWLLVYAPLSQETCATTSTLTHNTGGSYELSSTTFDATSVTASSVYWRMNFWSSSDTACPVQSYNFYSDSSYTTLITKSPTNSDTISDNLYSSYNRLKYYISGGDFTFYQRAVFVDNSEKPIEWNGIYQFTIVVTPVTCTITEGSFASGYSNIQQVQSNDADSSQPTYFVLPAYQSSCIFQISARTSISSLIANPVETSTGSGIYKVVPVSISTHQEIQIVVKITLADGTQINFGTATAENYKLQVGCSSAWVTMTTSSSLVTSITYNYSPNHDYVYTYINPTANPSYCSIVSNSITNISPAGPSISISNEAFMYSKVQTTNRNWNEQETYAQSKGMRTLTSAEAIAALNGAAFFPGESVWAPVTHNSNSDWIHLGDSGQSPGDIWSICCSGQDSTWQTGSPNSAAEWKAFLEKRGAYLFGAYSTDNTIVKFDKSTINSAFTFKVQSTDPAGNTYDSVDITFNVLTCDSDSGQLQYSGTQASSVQQDIYDNSITYSGCGSQTCRTNLNSGNAPHFPMLVYTSMQSNCNNLQIKCYDKLGTSLHSDLEWVTLADGTETCMPKTATGLDTVPNLYEFKIKIEELTGGHIAWLHKLGGIDFLTLDVVCSTYSNIVTISWSGSYTDQQIVDNSGNPKFYLPTFTQSNSNCPITTITTSSDQTSVISTGMQDPTDISSPTFIQPTDLTAEDLYNFYVFIQTTGSSSYYVTSQFQLQVGCGTSTIANIAEPAQTFTQTAQVTEFSTSTPTYLEYIDFTQNSQCQITLRTTNPISNANDLSSHLQVGTNYHIINSQPQLKRTAIFTWIAQFNGQSTRTKVSSQYTLDVQCGSTSTTITPPSILGVGSDGYYQIDLSASQNLEYAFTSTFSNSNDQCPITLSLVPVTGGTSSDYTSSDGISQVTISQTSPTILLQIPTFVEPLRTFQFKLQAEALGSSTYGTAKSYTDDIKIRVLGNCFYGAVEINETFSMIDITFEQDSITTYNADLSLAFYSDEPSCSQFTYSIPQVVDTQTSTQLTSSKKDQLAQITNTGQFSILQFSSVLSNHSITIKACNSEGVCASKHLLYLTITAKAVDLPFIVEVDAVEEEEVQVTEEETIQKAIEEEIGSDSSFNLVVPDADSSYEIISGVDQNFMTFDSETGQIQVSGFEEDQAGPYSIEMQVTNLETSSTQRLSIDLTLIYKEDQLQDENIEDSSSEILNTMDFSFMNEYTQDDKQENQIQEQAIQIEQERQKVYLNVTEISPNGQMTISFSEQLWALQHLGTFNITTLNLVKDQILANVTFICNTPEDYQDFKPNLTSWEVLDFTTFHLILKLNFTNKLYISIEEEDVIDIHFIETSLFRAYSQNVTLEKGYSLLDIRLPKQSKSEADFKNIQNIGNSAKGSMLLTLIVPLCFTLFMSVSMNRVWGLYNMLQIECNLLNFHFMQMPANAQYLLKVLKGISEFSIMSEPLVKDFLKFYIFKNAQGIQKFIFGQGVFVQMGCAITVAAVFVSLGLLISRRIYKFRPFFQGLKSKLMWSSLFRSQIQTFYPTFLRLLLFFDLLIEKEGLNQNNIQPFITSMLQLIFNMSLPIFSYIFLTKNFDQLDKPKFEGKYGTLYQNLNLNQRQACVYTSLFCLKRILFAISTCYLPNTVIANIYTYVYISMATIGYIINYRPMSSSMLNRIEIFNEYFMVATGYFMMHFTNWIPDIDFQYRIGSVFTYLVITIIGVNFALIAFEMFKELKKVYLKKKSDKAWGKYYEEKDAFIDLILEQMKPSVNKNSDKNTNLWQREILEHLTLKEMQQKMGRIDEVLNDIRLQCEDDSKFVMSLDQKNKYLKTLLSKNANLEINEKNQENVPDIQDQKVIELQRRVWLDQADQEEEIKISSEIKIYNKKPNADKVDVHNMAIETIIQNETDEHQEKFEQHIIQKQKKLQNQNQPKHLPVTAKFTSKQKRISQKSFSKNIMKVNHNLKVQEEEKTPEDNEDKPYKSLSIQEIQRNHDKKMRQISKTFNKFINHHDSETRKPKFTKPNKQSSIKESEDESDEPEERKSYLRY